MTRLLYAATMVALMVPSHLRDASQQPSRQWEKPKNQCELDRDVWPFRYNDCKGQMEYDWLVGGAEKNSAAWEFASTDTHFSEERTVKRTMAVCRPSTCEISQKIAVVADTRRGYVFDAKDTRPWVIGRITLDPNETSPDKTFGLTTEWKDSHGEKFTLDNRFLLVAELVKKLGPPSSHTDTRVGGFSIYGFTKDSHRPVRVFSAAESRGNIACAHKHADDTVQARAFIGFRSCKSAKLLSEILLHLNSIDKADSLAIEYQKPRPLSTFSLAEIIRENSSAIVQAVGNGFALGPERIDGLVARITLDELDGPVWYTCGVGCCTGGN